MLQGSVHHNIKIHTTPLLQGPVYHNIRIQTTPMLHGRVYHNINIHTTPREPLSSGPVTAPRQPRLWHQYGAELRVLPETSGKREICFCAGTSGLGGFDLHVNPTWHPTWQDQTSTLAPATSEHHAIAAGQEPSLALLRWFWDSARYPAPSMELSARHSARPMGH